MKQEDPLDLSALDPMREPEHWRAFVDTTLARVDSILATRPRDPLTLIASWSRLLVVSATFVVGVLVPVELVLERQETSREQIQQLVQFSARSVQGAGN